MTYLITGAAGFIGAALAEKLLRDGKTVYGLDNLNDYYSVALKQERIEQLQQLGGDRFIFRKVDLANYTQLLEYVGESQPAVILHMAAQASVRHALKNPQAYCHSNLVGHFNMLEVCRQYQEQHPKKFKHFVYASTSSIYGGNEKTPFEETDDVSRPVSLYAATKRADELMTYTYSHTFNLPATAVRFFTVYGPWGRPDMSPWLFASAILDNRPIPVFNHGDLWRDFTYVDDIVEGVIRLSDHIPQKTEKNPPHEIYNIGNNQPIKLLDYIQKMGKILGKEPILDLQEWPPTEVYKTYADTSKLETAIGWKPSTSLESGLQKFADWFVPYYTQQKS
ncbi:MAG: GDP-mannose 4,6-dehydratase [Alphaproteobacteria bacterium]|nr:GDP-mannose 4,6-dehydratase [Alphaproteobacteria bacterium]MDD9919171.1 GDP-mannose 4,6-dehydratase [Alphaproteobacteria bacterium]